LFYGEIGLWEKRKIKMSGCEEILRVEHLSWSAGGQKIIDDVSLSVTEGQFVAVVGPSGSGKSSLLKLINRLIEPDEGQVYVCGDEYRTIDPQTLRQQASLMMQTPHLFPGTVAQNVAFGPSQRGEEISRETIEDLLKAVGLAGFADRKVGELSGGEAQRVSLARVLANQPRVLLLDEPTSALDEKIKSSVEDVILRVIRENELTCLMITHDRAQAERMADEIVMLEQGKLVSSTKNGGNRHVDNVD
jgi:putative ABC transport system ATP-binding protein